MTTYHLDQRNITHLVINFSPYLLQHLPVIMQQDSIPWQSVTTVTLELNTPQQGHPILSTQELGPFFQFLPQLTSIKHVRLSLTQDLPATHAAFFRQALANLPWSPTTLSFIWCGGTSASFLQALQHWTAPGLWAPKVLHLEAKYKAHNFLVSTK